MSSERRTAGYVYAISAVTWMEVHMCNGYNVVTNDEKDEEDQQWSIEKISTIKHGPSLSTGPPVPV